MYQMPATMTPIAPMTPAAVASPDAAPPPTPETSVAMNQIQKLGVGFSQLIL